MKETLCERWEKEVVNTGSTCRQSHDGDSARVSTKVEDVVLDPVQCCHLVMETIVPRGGLILGGEEPEGVQSVLDGDQDHILLKHVLRAKVIAATKYEGTSMYVEDDLTL